jgi:hypothetical protein
MSLPIGSLVAALAGLAQDAASQKRSAPVPTSVGR